MVTKIECESMESRFDCGHGYSFIRVALCFEFAKVGTRTGIRMDKARHY